MTQDNGASLRDRAVVNGAGQAVSAVPASVPSAGDVFTVTYPFVRDSYTDFNEDGPFERDTWKPGVSYVQVSEDHSAPVADDIGQAHFTVVDAFKPGRFPTRVFYTRQFVTPDGKRFGKTRLHIATLEKFRRLTRGYRYPFGIGKPLPSDLQWWNPRQAEAEFRQLLSAYAAQGIEARSDKTGTGLAEGKSPVGDSPCAETPSDLSSRDTNNVG